MNDNNKEFSFRKLALQQDGLKHLNPHVGMVGSIIFFLTLFTFAHPDQEGYSQFRKCHGNCVNGILHAIGMPCAVSGVFIIVRAVTDSPEFTRQLQFCVISTYLYLYLQYEINPWTPWIFYATYMGIFDGILYKLLYRHESMTRVTFFSVGLSLVIINVGVLEGIGHGFFEHHHSYILEFFNSVFHTPLYGINSVMGLFQTRTDHVCW